MSDAPINPKKTFVKEKSEKLEKIKSEVKTLREDLNKLRENNASGTEKKTVHALISEKRAEYAAVRKSHFTPSA
jgi:hypothetical protein